MSSKRSFSPVSFPPIDLSNGVGRKPKMPKRCISPRTTKEINETEKTFPTTIVNPGFKPVMLSRPWHKCIFCGHYLAVCSQHAKGLYEMTVKNLTPNYTYCDIVELYECEGKEDHIDVNQFIDWMLICWVHPMKILNEKDELSEDEIPEYQEIPLDYDMTDEDSDNE